MTTPLPRRRGARMVGIATAAVVGLGGLTTIVAPAALADTQSTSDGASATVADVVAQGTAIHVEGTGWTGGSDPANGSTIGVKLGDALTTEPASGRVANPGNPSDTTDYQIWDAIEANADGTFSADIPFPTTTNTSPALASDWAPGTTHTLRLLTGSMESGDTGRSMLLTFTVGGDTVVSSATGGRGVSADQVTLTASSKAGVFQPGENVSATVDDNATQWTVDSGSADSVAAAADGSLASSKLVFTGGSLRAGRHTVILTGDQGTSFTTDVNVLPALTFSGLTQGASGTLSLADLPSGATISKVNLAGATFTGLPATVADDGTLTLSYTIAKDATLGTRTATVVQSAGSASGDSPAIPAATYTSAVKISPNDTVSGTNKFSITSTKSGDVGPGLYQTAYSAKQKALYVSDTNGLYKLNPDTLAVEEKVEDVTSVTDPDGNEGQTTYGIGVDDTNGTVWVTNTRSNTVAVYSEKDLSLLKQWTSDDTDAAVNHGRDVVYDPASNQVFISSASEGSSGEGYISVFEAGDNNKNGTPYEKIKDIDTGARSTFNPVSLALDTANHTLYSPSLNSNKVAAIDTRTDAVELLTLPGIQVNGRGATGIAYNAGRLYVASQNNDELLVANAINGATIKEVPTGTQPVSVDVDPVNKLVYTANFGGTTVTVTDLDGNKVANLPIAKANHVTVDGRGDAYVVDKSADNKVWKITPKAATSNPGGGNTSTNPGAGHSTAPSAHDQQVAKAKGKVTKDKKKVKKLKKKLKKAHGAKAKQLKKKLTKAKKQLRKAKKQLKKLK